MSSNSSHQPPHVSTQRLARIQPRLGPGHGLGSFVQTQCFLPRTGALMYVTRDREIAILDPASCKIVRQFPTLEPGNEFSTYIGNIRISPSRRLYTLPEAPGSIWGLAWSQDSQRPRHPPRQRRNRRLEPPGGRSPTLGNRTCPVAQVCNLPYRRFLTCGVWTFLEHSNPSILLP